MATSDPFIDKVRELARLVRLGGARDSGTDERMEALADELAAAVGEDGHPHEASQRVDSPTGEEVEPDRIELSRTSNDHGRTSSASDGWWGYVPGVGYIIEHGTAARWEKELVANLPKGKDGKPGRVSRHGLCIPEQALLNMAAEVNANKSMITASEQWRDSHAEHVERCHPGTDARDSAKDHLHKVSDDFHLDRSQSTIRIGRPSGHTYLNGSAVAHSQWVTIEVTGPSGRSVCTVGLSLEQFAAMLCSAGGQVPCTLERYWSVGLDSVMLRERVRVPPSVGERMEGRIRHRIEETMGNVRKVADDLRAAADAGKPVNKTQARTMATDLDRALEHAEANAEFAVEQSVEELSRVVESAVLHTSQHLGVPVDRLLASPELATGLGIVKPRDAKPRLAGGTAEPLRLGGPEPLGGG